jgi:hypothetical protein
MLTRSSNAATYKGTSAVRPGWGGWRRSPLFVHVKFERNVCVCLCEYLHVCCVCVRACMCVWWGAETAILYVSMWKEKSLCVGVCMCVNVCLCVFVWALTHVLCVRACACVWWGAEEALLYLSMWKEKSLRVCECGVVWCVYVCVCMSARVHSLPPFIRLETSTHVHIRTNVFVLILLKFK